jgi:ubiquinone biosynthesis accessory factor UbiK
LLETRVEALEAAATSKGQADSLDIPPETLDDLSETE